MLLQVMQLFSHIPSGPMLEVLMLHKLLGLLLLWPVLLKQLPLLFVLIRLLCQNVELAGQVF